MKLTISSIFFILILFVKSFAQDMMTPIVNPGLATDMVSPELNKLLKEQIITFAGKNFVIHKESLNLLVDPQLKEKKHTYSMILKIHEKNNVIDKVIYYIKNDVQSSLNIGNGSVYYLNEKDNSEFEIFEHDRTKRDPESGSYSNWDIINEVKFNLQIFFGDDYLVEKNSKKVNDFNIIVRKLIWSTPELWVIFNIEILEKFPDFMHLKVEYINKSFN